MNALVQQTELPRTRSCTALSLSRATFYRLKRPRGNMHGPRQLSVRALSQAQREAILTLLHSPRFRDQTAAHSYHALLGEGQYFGSIRTFQRVLKANGEARERRAIRPAQAHAVPRLEARAPNQVWTWDITKLATLERGNWLYLFVLIDLYSRYVVGFMLAETESSALAQRFVGSCIAHQQIPADTLTVHQDRGAPMTAIGYLTMLSELDIEVSHSRPRVSNDNPFSEAQFKTLKYQPDYPGRFTDLTHARQWCGEFIDWYNDEHHHSGLNGHIPADVFMHRADAVTATKQSALDQAYAAHPERFVKGRPKAKAPPKSVSINPMPAAVVTLPKGTASSHEISAKPEGLQPKNPPVPPPSTSGQGQSQTGAAHP